MEEDGGPLETNVGCCSSGALLALALRAHEWKALLLDTGKLSDYLVPVAARMQHPRATSTYKECLKGLWGTGQVHDEETQLAQYLSSVFVVLQ